MTEEALWQFYLQKNPHWQEDGAQLTAAGLRKLFEQIWEAGYREGHQQSVSAAIADQLSDAFSEFKGKRP